MLAHKSFARYKFGHNYEKTLSNIADEKQIISKINNNSKKVITSNILC